MSGKKSQIKHPTWFDASRRRFGAQLLQSAGTLAATLGSGAAAKNAQAAVAAEPRYLINIHTRGGLDAFWWQSYCRPDDQAAYLAANKPGVTIDSAFTQRFPSNQAITHPQHPEHFFGIGMSLFTPSDFARMAIVKGMGVAASHDFGNRIINCGQFSNYAAAFSSHISMDLATRMPPLPLHYVQVATSGTDLYAWPGLLSGYAIGVNIPDQATFASMTGSITGDFNAARRDTLAKTMATLAGAAQSSSFRLKQSQSYYASFMSSFLGMGAIYGTGLGSSPAFQATLDAYEAGTVSAYKAMIASYPALAAQLAYTGAASQIDNSTSAMRIKIRTVAFAFGLAEFLITNNLTRVIDIGPLGCFMDAHTDNAIEFNLNLYKYSMFQQLMNRLAQVQCPGMPGKSFMDQTTIVMTTEFDRTPNLSIDPPGSQAGTNHGYSASCIFAGRGVRGGSVIGDLKTADMGGKYAAFSTVGFAGGLPVGPDGLPNLNGNMISTTAIFPTVMSIFGVPIPGQQITDAKAVSAVQS